MKFQRLPGPVGQGYRLIEYISVARVRPRTSKGITNLLLPQTSVIIMHNLRELAHQRPIITTEQFLEQVAWPGALPLVVRPNEAAPLEPTPARVEPVPADPQSPVANPPSPELEVLPPSPPIIIISDSLIWRSCCSP
ncbi:hypothetical protein JHK84_027900 [Glycine max]|nr:hypothetical protein JHK84_027900 [Glycine max]